MSGRQRVSALGPAPAASRDDAMRQEGTKESNEYGRG